MNKQRKAAITAGALLIIMALIAGFSYGYAFGQIFVAGDAGATYTHWQRSQPLFEWGVAGFIMILLLDVVVAAALYTVFIQVNRTASQVMAWLRIIYCAFLLMALLPLIIAAVTMPGDGIVLTDAFRLFSDRWSAGLIVFGCHLAVLGYLCIASGRVPRAIGILVVFAGICYSITNLLNQSLPNYALYRETVDMILSLPMALGEICLAIWLWVKGAKATAPAASAS